MKTADAIWMCLPEGLDELFEMVRIERTEQSYDIWLDEKKKLSDEDYRNPNIVARGYTDYVTIQDYPMRGRPVFLTDTCVITLSVIKVLFSATIKVSDYLCRSL